MAAKQQKATFKISTKLSQDELESLGKDIVNTIRKRTEDGLGVPFGKSGIVPSYKKFPNYSENYIKSLDFKIAGKSKSKVDLTLSGDMLAALDVLQVSKNKIVIGYEKGTPENDRADGNIRGTYGKSSPNPKVAKPFLGLTREDLDALISRYES